MKPTPEELSNAIRSLDDDGRRALVLDLAKDPDLVEDLLDAFEILRARSESTRPYGEFSREGESK